MARVADHLDHKACAEALVDLLEATHEYVEASLALKKLGRAPRRGRTGRAVPGAHAEARARLRSAINGRNVAVEKGRALCGMPPVTHPDEDDNDGGGQ